MCKYYQGVGSSRVLYARPRSKPLSSFRLICISLLVYLRALPRNCCIYILHTYEKNDYNVITEIDEWPSFSSEFPADQYKHVLHMHMHDTCRDV